MTVVDLRAPTATPLLALTTQAAKTDTYNVPPNFHHYSTNDLLYGNEHPEHDNESLFLQVQK